MKKFFEAHYEKIILATLLVVFAALLYYQLLFVQKAQTQDVLIKVNPVPKPSDYVPMDFAGEKKYRMETIFSEWNKVEPTQLAEKATSMMSPYPLAECVHCHTLIPANSYPAISDPPLPDGECPACHKPLKPREKHEEVVTGQDDLNNNGISDEWEKEMKISAAFTDADSDEDSDGFTLLQEFKAKTDPLDPLSHPQYITQIFVSAIRQQRFEGLELVTVDTTKSDKKEWQATFNVVRNNRKRSEFVRIGIGTFKNNNVDFSLIDVEMDEKTQEPIAFIQRVGKQERIACRVKQPVYDPMPRVRLYNALYDRNITTAVGSDFKLGTAKSGEELYHVVSANTKTKEVIVYVGSGADFTKAVRDILVARDPEAPEEQIVLQINGVYADPSTIATELADKLITLQPVPKEETDEEVASKTQAAETKSAESKDSSPFLQKQ